MPQGRMQIRPSLFVLCASLLFAPAPPDFKTPSEAADGRKVDGQHEQAQGNHPETEDGQEAQHATHA